MAADQGPPGLSADVPLVVPGLRSLPDEQDEAPDLGVPVLLRSGFRGRQPVGVGLCQLGHVVGFLSVLTGKRVHPHEPG